MAKKWSNRNLPGALHFVTGNVHDRRPIFKNDTNCLAFLDEFQQLRDQRECKLIAFVLMPDHFHFVVNPRDGKIRDWCGALKSLAAKRLLELAPNGFFSKAGDENQVWQESFKALPLWSNWMIWQKINYIHNNPLKAKLVNSAIDYRWSSFRSFYFHETDPILRVDNDWWWPDDVQKLARSMSEWTEEISNDLAAGASRPS